MLNSAIQLKNYITNFWKFSNNNEENQKLIFNDDEIIIIINENDKNYIRNNIIDAVRYSIFVNKIKILKQLNQAIKKILKFDFEKIWKNDYMNKIITCFETNNQKEIYAGIILFHQVSKLYEFENEDSIKKYNDELKKINNYLISFLNQCTNLNDPIQSQFTYKILKIFFKNFQGDIPEIITNEAVFNDYSENIIKCLKFEILDNNLKNNIFWKLKNISYKIIARITQKYSLMQYKEINPFRELLINKFIPKFFDVIKTIYLSNDNKNYINNFCLKYTYDFFSYLINNNILVSEIILIYNNDLIKEKLIKDAILDSNDLELWLNEPKNYLNKFIDDLDLYDTKRYSVYKLLDKILTYKPNKEKIPIYFNEYFNYFLKVLELNKSELNNENNLLKNFNDQQFILNPTNIKNNLIKEVILYFIYMNYDSILDYNPDAIENLIKNDIFPELSSPCEILREKSLLFLIKFKRYNIKDVNIINSIIAKICDLLENDIYLPVKIYALMACSSLVNQTNVKNLLKGNIKTLLSIYIKLMNEIDLDCIIDSLQIIISEFKEEIRDFIVNLFEYLIKYFNKIIFQKSEEENNFDEFNLINNLIKTFSDIVIYFINDSEIYNQIEKYLVEVLNYCLLNIVIDKLEEGCYFLYNILIECNKIPNVLWKYFLPLIESVIGSPEEINQFKEEYPNKIYEGIGYDYSNIICKIIVIFISKDPKNFLEGKLDNNKNYIDYTMKYIEEIIKISETKSKYKRIKNAFDIIITIFFIYKGNVDNLLKQILQIINVKINFNNKIYQNKLKVLLGSCFIYNIKLCIEYLVSNNIFDKIINFYFNDLDKYNFNKIEIKFIIIGIYYLIVYLIENNSFNTDNKKTLNFLIILSNLLINKYENNINKNLNYNNLENYNKFLNDEFNNEEEDFDELDFDDYSDSSEEDDENKFLTLINFNKENELIDIKNLFNIISNKFPDFFKHFCENVDYNKLKEVFCKNN